LFAKQQQQQHKQQQSAYIFERLFNGSSNNSGSRAPASTLVCLRPTLLLAAPMSFKDMSWNGYIFFRVKCLVGKLGCL
jgi:hypothetical protein